MTPCQPRFVVGVISFGTAVGYVPCRFLALMREGRLQA